jgi:hypothetical protein
MASCNPLSDWPIPARRGSGAGKEEGQEAERGRAGKRSQPGQRCDGAAGAHRSILTFKGPVAPSRAPLKPNRPARGKQNPQAPHTACLDGASKPIYVFCILPTYGVGSARMPSLQPDAWRQMAEAAAQLGPFFFAIIFIVFVPIIGQQYFRAFLEQQTKAGKERDAAMKVYTFYWLSGIVTGLILVIISVLWYIYVNVNYVLVDRATVFEAKITGIKESDYLSSHDVFNTHHKVYITRAMYNREPVALVAVVFNKTNEQLPVINLFYMKDEDYRKALDSNGGFLGSPAFQISLCLKHKELVLIRDAPNEKPRFDKDC